MYIDTGYCTWNTNLISQSSPYRVAHLAIFSRPYIIVVQVFPLIHYIAFDKIWQGISEVAILAKAAIITW